MAASSSILDFETMENFFTDLMTNYKKKYPMIITYVKKHLNCLDDEKKDYEVSIFKKFLIQNQSLSDHKFDNFFFKTGKRSLTLNMENFIPQSSETDFWNKIIKLEKFLFPNGKPGITETDENIDWLENDSIMGDIYREINNSMDLESLSQQENFSPSTLFNKPEVQRLAKNIQGKLENGQYSVSNLIETITKIIDSKTIQKDASEETKSSLTEITGAMKDIQGGNSNPNISKLLDLITNIKIPN